MEGINLFIMVVAMSNSSLFFVNAFVAEGNSFNSNINYCLFLGWRTGSSPVLSSKVKCNGKDRAGLCYGLNQRGRRTATFAVCYSKTTLIPEFSGHVVSIPAGGGRASGRDAFRNERGSFKPNPQSDQAADYGWSKQTFVPDLNLSLQRFYSRGHLTPNGAFTTVGERALTMVNTNIAPQWQQFNSQNWAVLERAVREYSQEKQRSVYVFTGTGGQLMGQVNGQQVALRLNGRVQVPKYFWKAVCDPVAKSSVVFVAQNPTGAEGNQKENGCSLKIPDPTFKQEPMTRVNGIIFCHSIEALKYSKEAPLFKLPPFSKNCNPSKRGEFLDIYLRHLN